MARIKMPAARSTAKEITFEEAFHIFLTDSAAHGLAEKTLKTYRTHLRDISHYSPLAQIKSSSPLMYSYIVSPPVSDTQYHPPTLIAIPTGQSYQIVINCGLNCTELRRPLFFVLRRNF